MPTAEESAADSATEEVIESRDGEIGSDLGALLAKDKDGFTGVGRELSQPSVQALNIDAVT